MSDTELLAASALRGVAWTVTLAAFAASVLLVFFGYTWCVVGVAIGAYTLGLLSGMSWFLDPWLAASRRRPG